MDKFVKDKETYDKIDKTPISVLFWLTRNLNKGKTFTQTLL